MDQPASKAVFQSFCDGFHQDVVDIHGSLEDAVRYNVNLLSKADRAALYAWLNDLLSGALSDAELKGLLSRTMRELSFNSRGARFFLETVKASLQGTIPS